MHSYPLYALPFLTKKYNSEEEAKLYSVKYFTMRNLNSVVFVLTIVFAFLFTFYLIMMTLNLAQEKQLPSTNA